MRVLQGRGKGVSSVPGSVLPRTQALLLQISGSWGRIRTGSGVLRVVGTGPSSTSCQTTLAAPFFTPSLITLALTQLEPPLSHSTPCSNPASLLSLQSPGCWAAGNSLLAEATPPVCESFLSLQMARSHHQEPLALAIKEQNDASFSVYLHRTKEEAKSHLELRESGTGSCNLVITSLPLPPTP